MWIFKIIGNYLCFSILVTVLSFVESQRLCRYRDGCILFPNERDAFQSQIPVFSPIPITTPLYREPSIQQQQILYSPPHRIEQQNSFQGFQSVQQTVKEPTLSQDQFFNVNYNVNYDSPIAKNVSLSILNFAQKLSRHFQSSSLNGEHIFSPISIYSVLQLLLTGASGKTYKELNQFLSYYSNMGSPAYQEEFGKLIEDLVTHENDLKRRRPDAEWKNSVVPNNNNNEKDEPKTIDDKTQKVKLANGVFIQDNYPIRPAYKNAVEDIYKSEIKSLNFKQQQSANYINEWVNQRTHGKIPSIVDPNGISHDTSLIMACAVYFKAFWEKPFISGGTMVNDFYPDGKDGPAIKVNMMANGGVFPYYDDPEYKIKVIGFPYKDGPTTMYIFQPHDSTRQRLRHMQELLNPEMIEYMISQMKKKTAVFVFPRLHVTNSFNLKNILMNMGLHSIFSIRNSDLSLIPELKFTSAPVQRVTEHQRPIYEPITATQFTDNTNIQNINRPTQRAPGSDIVFLNRFGDIGSETNSTSEDIIETNTDKINATTAAPTTHEKSRDKRAVTYKVEREDKRKEQPLRFKDLVINKRITKLNKGKKITRSRRQVSPTTPNQILQYLQSIRNDQNLIRPDLFVDNIVHKIDLVVNEEGTEGAAATVTYLRRSGTDIVFRADAPFLIVLRHDPTKIPLFYGAIFEPSFN